MGGDGMGLRVESKGPNWVREAAVGLGVLVGRPALHLLKQRVVGAVQVELAQVVAVGEDQKWLLIWRQRVLAELLAGTPSGTLGPQPIFGSALPALPPQLPAASANCTPSKHPSHQSQPCSCGGRRRGGRSPPHTDTCSCRGC